MAANHIVDKLNQFQKSDSLSGEDMFQWLRVEFLSDPEMFNAKEKKTGAGGRGRKPRPETGDKDKDKVPGPESPKLT